MRKRRRAPAIDSVSSHDGSISVTWRRIERKDLVKDRVRWRVEWPDATKRSGRGHYDAHDRGEARHKATAILNELEEGRDARSKAPKFARVWREWDAMREEEGLAPSTRAQDKLSGRYLCDEFGRKAIDSILPIDAERWLKTLVRSKPERARQCRMQLGQVFRFARRKKYLTANPLSDDPIRLLPRESKRKWVPSWDDMDRLVVIGRGRRPNGRQGHPRVSWSNTKVAIALGGGAGLRIGEVVALRWQDIDWINRVLHVRVARGSRGIDLPKKRKIRDVPMTQWVYDTLLDQKHLLETLGRKIDGQILYNRYTKGKPLDQNAVNDTFKRFVVYAGLLESVRGRHEWHTHVLRRFYISARFALQHPPLEILEAVGHEDLKVTMKHYARALPEPPPIWRHRFQPAEPDDATRVIDGSGAVVVDGIAQLPAPEGADIDAGVPEWLREAHRYLEGGWKIKEVAAYFGRSRGHLSEAFRRHGLRPPIEIYRGALYERYEQLYNEGVPPCDIATMTGTSRQTYHAWVTAHEAGVPNTTRSLKKLRKSERAQGSVARNPKQMKLRL